jgi:phosphatidylglycerol:prolipoprotein diacylglycerol transferase
MHPHLFDAWGFSANAYGTLILLGGTLSLFGVRWDARGRGIAHGRLASFIVDFYLVLIVGAFVGGRILHVLTVPGVYAEDPGKLLAIDSTGFVFFGSLLAVVGGWVWLSRRYGVAFGELTDLGLTWMGLGHAFGRLGCFMAGCCWGGPTDGPTGVRFPEDSVVHLVEPALRVGTHTVSLHPTQLYEAAGLLVLLAILLAFRVRRGIEARWRQASRYALGYGLLRLFVEMFRGDASRGFVLEGRWPALAEALALPPDQPLVLSISQALALAIAAAGVYGLRLTRQESGYRR